MENSSSITIPYEPANMSKLCHIIKQSVNTFDSSINNEKIKEMFKKKEVPANYMCPHRTTPLTLACMSGNLELVRILIKYGAIVGTRDEELYHPFNNIEPPITIVSRRNHIEIVEELLLNGADPNVQRRDGYTPLMLAAWNGHLKVVKLLLGDGAQLHFRTKDSLQRNALELAKRAKHPDIVHLLEEAEAADGLIESINNTNVIYDNINNVNSRKNLYPTPKLVPRRGTSLIRRSNMAALKGLPSEEELSMRFEGRTRRKKPVRGRSLTRSKRNTYKPVHRI